MRLAFLFCRIICRHPKVHFYVIKCAHLCDLFLVIFFYSFETQSYPSLQSFDRSSILHSLVLLLRFCTLILLESVVSLIPFVRYLILIYLRLYFSDILFCVSVLIFFFGRSIKKKYMGKLTHAEERDLDGNHVICRQWTKGCHQSGKTHPLVPKGQSKPFCGRKAGFGPCC